MYVMVHVYGGLHMSDIDNINCMMCLAHIVDGAPHEGPVYQEAGVVHATAYKGYHVHALVCTLVYDSGYYKKWHGFDAKWVKVVYE